jgi:hypothetical protein
LGCRARRRRSRLRGTRPRASSGSTTLRSPHDRRRARQGTGLRRRRLNVVPLTPPASGGARRLAGSHLGAHRGILGDAPETRLNVLAASAAIFVLVETSTHPQVVRGFRFRSPWKMFGNVS